MSESNLTRMCVYCRPTACRSFFIFIFFILHYLLIFVPSLDFFLCVPPTSRKFILAYTPLPLSDSNSTPLHSALLYLNLCSQFFRFLYHPHFILNAISCNKGLPFCLKPPWPTLSHSIPLYLAHSTFLHPIVTQRIPGFPVYACRSFYRILYYYVLRILSILYPHNLS